MHWFSLVRVCVCVRVHVYMRACMCFELSRLKRSALLLKPRQIALSLPHSRHPEASFQHEIYLFHFSPFLKLCPFSWFTDLL